MSKAERAVCARIRQFREQIKCTQPLFAELIGITKDSLVSIEYGRTPLRYGIARRLCEHFDLSQVWLAEKLGLPNPTIPFDENIESRMPQEMLFSQAYQLFLRPLLTVWHWDILQSAAQSGIPQQFIYPVGLTKEGREEWALRHEIAAVIGVLPEAIRPDFAQAVLAAIKRFCEEQGIKPHGAGYIRPKDWLASKPVPFRPTVFKRERITQNTVLTNAETFPKSISTKPLLPDLLDRLRKATATPGKKSELANTLGRALGHPVPLASVSRWLSGKREPGGEVAFQMDDWATRQGFPPAKQRRQKAK